MANFAIGNIGEFNELTETWKSYTERVKQFFMANEISDDRKVPALLALMEGNTYSLLRNLTSPDDPATKGFDAIVKLLDNHLSPKPLVIAERFRFHKRDQKDGESIPVYVAELRKLSEHCDFKADLNDALRDRLVCGIKHGNIQKKLLSESDLTLQTAIDIATAMETAAKDAVELQQQHRPDSVHKLSKKPTSNTKPKERNKACFRCDRFNHTPDECRFKEDTCRFCSKKGHIERACLSKKAQQKNQSKKKKFKPVKTVDKEELLTVSINTVNRSDIISVTPKIEGKYLKMELDTGSAISVIPIRIYKELFHHIPLSVTKTRLTTYSGQTITPAGIINVSVNYEGQEHNLDLFVVKNDSPSLFGRAWLKYIKLDWNSIKFLQTGKTTDENLQDILKKYKSVFTEQSGKVKGVQATLTLKENAQPKFCKARPVPYALKDKVEKELERLENEGIIQKVDHSDWATPIVAVPKGDNTVRICGDYKTTVNPQLQVDQYPLPKIQDIFASLAGGQRFTKIDLRQAYNQLEMKELSRSFFWWPKLDSDIEQLARKCSGCQIHQKAPPKASLHPWEWPSAPWERIHIDFAGPFLGHMFLIAVDAHSKWPEVHVMNTITASKTIDVLRQIFAQFGVVKQIISDNGRTFTSAEFQNFVKNNGIIHKTSAPWHPATQGLVERFVQTFKQAMKSALTDGGSLNQKITCFLLQYRNAVHATTNESPAKLLLGRQLRSRLDLIKPNTRDTVEKKQFESFTEPKRSQFSEGEKVMVRDYRENTNKRTDAKITEKSGPLSYKVTTGDQGTWRRHADQMVRTSVESTRPSENSSDVNLDISAPNISSESLDNSNQQPAETQPVRRYPLRNRKPPDRLTYKSLDY